MKPLSGLLGSRTPPKAEKPLRDELLSIERLEDRALQSILYAYFELKRGAQGNSGRRPA